jgi:Cu/Zn superoxide dismutase
MSKISRRGLRVTAAAAGAGVIAVAAWATAAHARPADAATSTMKGGQVTLATIRIRVQLSPMPQGTVTFGRDRRGDVDVTVNAFGLTPGSSHKVDLVNGSDKVITSFSRLTANSVGRARFETLDSGYKGALGSWRVVIRNGTAGNRVAAEPIARTSRHVGNHSTYQLVPVEASSGGKSWGIPQGSAVLAYDRDAKTISVTVNASGFTPGTHAAHIHVGSCVSQGPVQFMLKDFTANASGRIVNETRVVTHVTAPLAAAGWYLNLHQGNSRNIVAHGSPTINFRPLICGDIVT